FAIGATRSVVAPPFVAPIPVASTIRITGQLAINIGDVSVAVRRQRRVHPISIASLAPGIDPAITHTDVAAGKSVVTLGLASTVIAAETAVDVGNVSSAAIDVAQ